MCLTADCLRFHRSVTTDKARGYYTGPCLPVAPSKEKITGEGISLGVMIFCILRTVFAGILLRKIIVLTVAVTPGIHTNTC